MSSNYAATTNKHQVVIIGAGFGGNGVITGLLNNGKTIPDNIEVTLLDRKTKFSIGGTWQFIWSSRLDGEDAPEWDMSDLKANNTNGINLIKGETDATVDSINTSTKEIILANGNNIKYDTLVLSPGVVSDASLIKGLAESSALDICNIKDVPKIKLNIDKLMEDAAKSTTPKTILMCVTKMPYKCPPVPFEIVSILDDIRRERNVSDKVKILLSVPVPFPFAGPPAAKVFKQLLKDMNVEYLPNHVVTEIKDKTNVVYNKIDADGGNETKVEITPDLLLCTFPQRAPDFCKPLCNEKGLIPVDLQTNLIASKENNDSSMYAIGDACIAMFPVPKKPHPKAGEFAFMMGQHVADQIIAKVVYSGSSTIVPPPKREASCVAECGIDGKGVNIQPNFTDILANPNTGMPKFNFPFINNASDEKMKWVNKYLKEFFIESKTPKFG